MPAFICTTCGTRFTPSDVPPPRCPICDEERQYVPESGQTWTTPERLSRTHRNAFLRPERDLYAIETTPNFAIAQRAHLLRTPAGNVLWDCIALLDDATFDIVTALGGIGHIAISHPHYYTTMCAWSRAFGAPIHLHEADRAWVQDIDGTLDFWKGDRLDLGCGLTVLRLGGHFDGAAVLHWRDGADGAGALLSGDTVQVVADRNRVSFMYSYPNQIPLPAAAIKRIGSALAPYRFERIYGAFGRTVWRDGKQVVERSVARYLQAIGADSA
jgi:hypothetical protein